MNKILNLCIVVFMGICMVLVDIFMSTERWLFKYISIVGIIISVCGLIYANKYLFNK